MIALVLSERHPQAGLAPAPGTPLRAAFLRRLVWIVANVYPTFSYGDHPGRWVSGDASSLKASTDAHRERLWRDFESDVGEGGWVRGPDLCVLDIYVAVMTRWRPRRAWFAAHCPRLYAIAARADHHPLLEPVLRRNFPPADG